MLNHGHTYSTVPQVDELLIGSNVLKALEPLELVCSVNDGLYVVRTLLGWTVNSPLTGRSGKTVNCQHPQITVNRVSVMNLDDLCQQQLKNESLKVLRNMQVSQDENKGS